MTTKITTLTKSFVLFFAVMISFLFSGCATQEAQSYLKANEIEKGLELTSKELIDSPTNSSMNYYNGRFLLRQGKYKDAIKSFQKAYASFPYNLYHKFWLGVAYGKNKQYDKEREVYLDILDKTNWRYRSALAYLGKNYYRTKQYDKAKEMFEKGLFKYRKPHSYMYYYYASTLNKMGQKEEAKKYYHKYLSTFPEFSLAKYAVYNLNKLGDFTYSNFKIGDKRVGVKNISFLNNSTKLEHYSKNSLKMIMNQFSENEDLTLYIVSYDKTNLKKAEQRVKSIKKFILEKFPDVESTKIKIAWLKTSKEIKVGNASSIQNNYVNFFTKN